MNLEEIIRLYKQNADPQRAKKQEAYMRNQFRFLGLQTPIRRKLSKDFLKEQFQEKKIDWQLVDKLWTSEEREFQYLARDYLKKMEKFLQASNMSKIYDLALRKSWWDTVDSLDELVGILLKQNPELKETVLTWSKDENFWIRRIAIDCQLTFKAETDTDLLEQVILNNLGSDEFFINKAIGWSLRDYSKVNPEWVRDFIDSNRTALDKLSISEGSKYI